jgi:hypothetical protein
VGCTLMRAFHKIVHLTRCTFASSRQTPVFSRGDARTTRIACADK